MLSRQTLSDKPKVVGQLLAHTSGESGLAVGRGVLLLLGWLLVAGAVENGVIAALRSGSRYQALRDASGRPA